MEVVQADVTAPADGVAKMGVKTTVIHVEDHVRDAKALVKEAALVHVVEVVQDLLVNY